MTQTDKTYRNERVELDGGSFVNCSFEECEMVYSGGPPPRMEGCRISGGSWSFAGAAANTVAFMHGLYHGLGEGGRHLIERAFDDIRRPPGQPNAN